MSVKNNIEISRTEAREAALMTKLEAAEKDIALKERVIDSLGSELNAVASERDTLRAELTGLRNSMTFRTSLIGRIEAEREGLHALIAAVKKQVSAEFRLRMKKEIECNALRAKVEEMEKQEPPRGWWDDLIADISAIDCMYRGSPTYAHDAYWMRDRVVWMLKQRRDSTPGAQSAQSALAGARKVTRDFYWDSAALHHVPFVRVEFQPVAANSPNDAKGWQDRDRFFAAMLVAAGNVGGTE